MKKIVLLLSVLVLLYGCEKHEEPEKVIPKKENYAMRIFLNDKKRLVKNKAFFLFFTLNSK